MLKETTPLVINCGGDQVRGTLTFDCQTFEMTFDEESRITADQVREAVQERQKKLEARTSSGCGGCGSEKKRLSIAEKLAGGAKLTKAALGLDPADAETVERRKLTCSGCEAYDFGVCNDCGCYLAAKVKLAGEKCPREKW